MGNSFVSNQNRHAKKITSFIEKNKEGTLTLPKLYKILKLYEEWSIFAGKNRSEIFEKDVLYYIAKRTYWSDIEDGQYVCKLLVHLYQMDKNFWFILDPQADFYPPRMSFNKILNHPARFFFNHAYRQKLTINGKRIADAAERGSLVHHHPCILAVRQLHPSTLQLLLQYGACITDEAYADCIPLFTRIAILRCVSHALRVLLEILNAHEEQTQQVKGRLEFEMQEFQKAVLCAKLLLGVCPKFEKKMMSIVILEIPRFMSAEEATKWICENGVSERRFRTYWPMTLKHACRLKVRKALHDNWQLPHGIHELQIPESLKSFLNLCCD